jgi:hypothetical protein
MDHEFLSASGLWQVLVNYTRDRIVGRRQRASVSLSTTALRKILSARLRSSMLLRQTVQSRVVSASS